MPEVFAQHARSDAYAQRLRIRRIFDRRAACFNEVAFLPREIARRMHERLDYIKLAPKHVLDAGCGPGADLPFLSARFAQAAVMGVDLSHRMSARARRNPPAASAKWRRLLKALSGGSSAHTQTVVQADFAMLPFLTDTFDLLWSNLALHWHARPYEVVTEWQRILNKGGVLMFSTLGPDSLRELRAAWRVADASTPQPRVISFIDMHDLGDMLARSGFETPVMDMEMLTLTYRSPAALLNDVRRWGAYPFDRPLTGLMGRRQYATLNAALEAQHSAGGQIELSFEVVYGHAWKKSARTSTISPEGYGVVKLENILGRTLKKQP